jgi:hypothetical protein
MNIWVLSGETLFCLSEHINKAIDIGHPLHKVPLCNVKVDVGLSWVPGGLWVQSSVHGPFILRYMLHGASNLTIWHYQYNCLIRQGVSPFVSTRAENPFPTIFAKCPLCYHNAGLTFTEYTMFVQIGLLINQVMIELYCIYCIQVDRVTGEKQVHRPRI